MRAEELLCHLNRQAIALAIPCLHAVSVPTAVSASVMALPSRGRNLAHLKSSRTSNLNELVEQEVLISRILHTLDYRLDAPPLFRRDSIHSRARRSTLDAHPHREVR